MGITRTTIRYGQCFFNEINVLIVNDKNFGLMTVTFFQCSRPRPMLHSLDMKNASPNFIIDIESIHCKCSRSSSQICQLTDLCVEVIKLLSVDPQNYCDAPREGSSIMEKS
ncbi:unnamed protein product [Clavelina lepadiformis]|uniref:Uncharacterized protein n=1 Tax=Clavelina lepadiformis TaxID=159417 RepID=A0ABP0G6Y9_CLALP